MTSEESFEVQFDVFDESWFCLKLINDGAMFKSCPDGFMHDSILETVEIIEGLCNGRRDELVVRWYELPFMYQFHFLSQNDDLILRVDEYPDVPKRAGMSRSKKIVFEAQTDRKQMCLTFWRAIRKMQSQFSPEKYAEHWKHPFPVEQVESLTSRIKG